MPRTRSRSRRGAPAALEEYRGKRDFSRTPEPAGDAPAEAPPRGEELAFVVQKHDARNLHYDLRLEMGGVMRSWAVPKGPSLDPAVRRLAVEVEDHPRAYNDFEGTIPAGEYGGGTVMLWDRGTFAPAGDDADAADPEAALRRAHRRGKLVVSLEGEKLRGTFSLVRTSRGGEGRKPQWLLAKLEDAHARPGSDVAAEAADSVASGRSLPQIERGEGGRRVWRSKRTAKPAAKDAGKGADAPDLSALSPMLATSGLPMPRGEGWTFEPKYDGIRVLAFATPDAAALVTRNGNDKAAQFPEVAEALRALARELGEPAVLDGELVGVRDGRVVRFESLQGRMHLGDPAEARRLAEAEPASLAVFDLLLRGDEVLLHEPWTARRRALEALLEGRAGPRLLLGETSPDGRAMEARAAAAGWEGLIAKRTAAAYRPGARSRDWIKLKLERQQELVVGGWTEPRRSRKHLGALLLGYYDPAGDLVYAGHTGTGFSREALEALHRRLRRLERKTPPFRERPATNETPHWTTPKVVVQVRFNEWTSDGKLRQPVFLGVRDDVDPRAVVREPGGAEAPETPPETVSPAPLADAGPAAARLRKLRASRSAGGTLSLGRGGKLALSRLDKVFFPESGITKGELMEYYAALAPLILPRMADRPLVLRRFPDGIGGEAFYQQSAPDDVPPGVRVETLEIGGKRQARLVGGDLATLLYTVQLGAVSYDPWHSRVGRLESADYTILDLDPGEGVDFRGVVEVARRVREEMEALGLHGALKTSGSSGLHVYLPLPGGTPLDAATLVAQIVATRVARKHPRLATVERMRRKRRRGTVYVDYLQNLLGKTVAGVYAVRAKPGATVSTPLAWAELSDDLDLRDFTLRTVPGRVAEVGDLWEAAMRTPNDLESLLTGGTG